MTIMLISRINLIVTAAVFFIYGVPPVFDPAAAASVLGLSIDDANGAVSIRAIYGGYLIGAGLIFAITAMMRAYLRAGLCALLLIVSPILVSRCAGLSVEQYISFDQLFRAGMEAASIVVTGVLLGLSLKNSPDLN